jgi:hypothetical protein
LFRFHLYQALFELSHGRLKALYVPSKSYNTDSNLSLFIIFLIAKSSIKLKEVVSCGRISYLIIWIITILPYQSPFDYLLEFTKYQRWPIVINIAGTTLFPVLVKLCRPHEFAKIIYYYKYPFVIRAISFSCIVKPDVPPGWQISLITIMFS